MDGAEHPPMAMEVSRAFSKSSDKRVRIKDTVYSIKRQSHGIVIGPLHGKPNWSSDVLNSSMKMGLLRYAKGTIKRLPSMVYTTKCPLSATDLVHDSASTDLPVLDVDIFLLAFTANLCHFLAIFRSL
ncbi:hypothetical protein AAC387_Pa04g1936 [Persea americana]